MVEMWGMVAVAAAAAMVAHLYSIIIECEPCNSPYSKPRAREWPICSQAQHEYDDGA